MVQRLGVKTERTEAMRALVGGVTATELRTATLSDAAFTALCEGLSDPNPQVRWWCIQLLDHVPDERAVVALANALDDPVPRVRRNAAHALGCVACKPAWDGHVSSAVLQRFAEMAENDPNAKVRAEARAAVSRQQDS
ncbi:MAG TPA: HEAT repeat domain-containing protein [Egicoccus sp.]|nr:HEAT repeat domain-containing protein [Egicoccus sp.]HSK21613.1 HEAT repeat domain-containing protein [Egicoccus sp.]